MSSSPVAAGSPPPTSPSSQRRGRSRRWRTERARSIVAERQAAVCRRRRDGDDPRAIALEVETTTLDVVDAGTKEVCRRTTAVTGLDPAAIRSGQEDAGVSVGCLALSASRWSRCPSRGGPTARGSRSRQYRDTARQDPRAGSDSLGVAFSTGAGVIRAAVPADASPAIRIVGPVEHRHGEGTVAGSSPRRCCYQRACRTNSQRPSLRT